MPDLLGLITALEARQGKLLRPLIERMLAHSEPLRNFRNRIGSLTASRLKSPLEISFAHKGPLTSKFGKKASTILGGIHFPGNEEMYFAIDISHKAAKDGLRDEGAALFGCFDRSIEIHGIIDIIGAADKPQVSDLHVLASAKMG